MASVQNVFELLSLESTADVDFVQPPYISASAKKKAKARARALARESNGYVADPLWGGERPPPTAHADRPSTASQRMRCCLANVQSHRPNRYLSHSFGAWRVPLLSTRALSHAPPSLTRTGLTAK